MLLPAGMSASPPPAAPPVPPANGFVPKAESVTAQGEADGFVPQAFFKAELLPGGFTRLVISLPPERMEAVHRALVSALAAPLKLLYSQLTDRKTKGQLPKPLNSVAVELPGDRLLQAMERYRGLIYQDGRHQLWIRGALGEQVVLEEIGMLYCYPDDPLFRDTLVELGVPEGKGPTMAERDYIRVNFSAAFDAEEEGLFQDLHLVHWDG